MSSLKFSFKKKFHTKCFLIVKGISTFLSSPFGMSIIFIVWDLGLEDSLVCAQHLSDEALLCVLPSGDARLEGMARRRAFFGVAPHL